MQRDPSGIVVVYYPDRGLLDWITAQVTSIAGEEARPLHARSVDEAIIAKDRLALLLPENERETILELDALRDQILTAGRRYPLVLFLLRGGSGQKALATEVPGLWSVIRGSDPDPLELSEIDADAERASFVDKHGKEPEAWLAEWRAGALPSTSENLATAYEAMLFEDVRDG